jgi:hypothetical protein
MIFIPDTHYMLIPIVLVGFGLPTIIHYIAHIHHIHQ